MIWPLYCKICYNCITFSLFPFSCPDYFSVTGKICIPQIFNQTPTNHYKKNYAFLAFSPHE